MTVSQSRVQNTGKRQHNEIVRLAKKDIAYLISPVLHDL